MILMKFGKPEGAGILSLRLLAVVVAAALLIQGCDLFVESPTKRSQRIVQMILTGKFDELYPMLSNLDRKVFEANQTQHSKKEADDHRRYQENSKIKIPKDDYEAWAYMTLSEFSGPEEPDQPKGLMKFFSPFVFPKYEVRSGNYAQVTYIVPMPLEGNEVAPWPIVFVFLREGREWKFSLNLSLAQSSGMGLSNSDSSYFDNLELIWGFRPPPGKTKVKEYPVPESVSKAYEEIFNKIKKLAKGKKIDTDLMSGGLLSGEPGFLMVWMVIGDPKAKDFAKELFTQKSLDSVNKQSGLWQKQYVLREIPTREPDERKRAEKILKSSSVRQNIYHQQKYLETFKDQKDLCGQVKLGMAESLGYGEEFERAEKVYLDLIRNHSDQKEIFYQAQNKLAKLYSEHLDRYDDAYKIWAELQAEGKLDPAVKPFKVKAHPEILVEYGADDDRAYNEPVRDFRLDSNGNLLVLRAVSEEKNRQEYDHEKTIYLQHTIIEKLDAQGKNAIKLFDKIIEDNPWTFFLVKDQPYLLLEGGLVFADNQKEFRYKTELPETKGVYLFEGDTAAVIDKYSLRIYDWADKKLTKEYPLDPALKKGCVSWLLKNRRGQYVISQPCFKRLVIYDPETGARIIPDRPLPLDALSELSGMFTDFKGNLYLLDRNIPRILQINGQGQPVREITNDRIVSIESATVDPAGNFYISGFARDTHWGITIMDQRGKIIGSMEMPARLSYLAAAKDYVVVNGGKQVAGYNREGKILSNFKADSDLSSIPLYMNPRHQVYFLAQNKLYLYKGDKSAVVFDLGKLPKKYDSEQIPAGQIHFIDNDNIAVRTSEPAFDKCNLKDGSIRPMEAFKDFQKSRIDGFVFDGRAFWFLHRNTQGYGETPSELIKLQRVSPDGKILAEFTPGKSRLPWDPAGIALDSKDRILVNDAANSRLLLLSPEGDYLAEAYLKDYLPKSRGWGHMRMDKSDRIYFLQGNKIIRFKLDQIFSQ